MTDLFIEDVHHLNSAKGWIELGNHVEARKEYYKFRNRGTLEAVELRWQIETLASQHGTAYKMACWLVQQAPDRYEFWIGK